MNAKQKRKALTVLIHHVEPVLRNPLAEIATHVASLTTSAEVMRKSRLDWTVLQKPLVTSDGIEIKTHKALFRSDKQIQLGIVGANFNPLQNAEAFDFCDSLVKTGRMDYLSAGQFDNGRRIFIQCQINRGEGETEIAKGDFVINKFLLANGHDGSLAVRAIDTATRVVCQNTFRHALSSGGTHCDLKIRHTRNMMGRLEVGKDLLSWANASFTEFVAKARDTVKRVVTTEQKLKDFFRETFQVEQEKIAILEKEGGETLLKQRENRLSELFMEGAGQSNPAVRGTGWAALNAVTQYLDHESRTSLRGIDLNGVGPDETARARALNRFESNVLGNNAKIKERALELALKI
jgi:phage/plasmid-like protein (TIGR03299 family)